MRVALLVTHIRAEEKLILAAFNKRDISPDIILDRELNFEITQGAGQLAPSGIAWRDYDMIFERCVSTSRGMYALAILNSWGLQTFNTYETAAACSDKLRTSVALMKHNIPQPHTRVAFTPESAMQAIEDVKYPAVLKPVTGSWDGCWRASTIEIAPRPSSNIAKRWAITTITSITCKNMSTSRVETSAPSSSAIAPSRRSTASPITGSPIQLGADWPQIAR